MAMTQAEQQRQVKQAEELLFSGPQCMGFAKGLFFGRFVSDWVMPFPYLPDSIRSDVYSSVDEVRCFLDETLDAERIDRQADIDPEVIEGLARLGVLGMTAPTSYGGRGFSQQGYCQVLEQLGARCAATSIFVNAHHSIGIRALLLFGTEEQKARWLPALVRGDELAAFALTEVNAGSDAANVQTHAELSDDGSHYILNGDKRYITNGSIARVLTVMARTPLPDKPGEFGVTAFLVTPDMEGFQVTEPRMDKLGIRGTATAKLAFNNMCVPVGNVLGEVGKGLKVALTVLDFGRTTFGACCTGAATKCLELAVSHARERQQFGQAIGEFELVRKKIAKMAAWTYAMEAMSQTTASLIDRGLEDYMLETAMLKVYTTEALWEIVNDAFQIHGGAAYFKGHALERMLRDARINQIGEGANDVLMSFIALVGMRGPGEELMDVWHALHHPLSELRKVWRFGVDRIDHAVHTPEVPVQSYAMRGFARDLGSRIKQFNQAVVRSLIKHGETILDRQLVQERIARIAMELFACACVVSRADAELVARENLEDAAADPAAVYFLNAANRRIDGWLEEIRTNDDDSMLQAAQFAMM